MEIDEFGQNERSRTLFFSQIVIFAVRLERPLDRIFSTLLLNKILFRSKL